MTSRAQRIRDDARFRYQIANGADDPSRIGAQARQFSDQVVDAEARTRGQKCSQSRSKRRMCWSGWSRAASSRRSAHAQNALS
jgi:hypothetical protein